MKKRKNKRVYLLCVDGYPDSHPKQGHMYVGEPYQRSYIYSENTDDYYRLYATKESTKTLTSDRCASRFTIITPQKYYALKRKQQTN